MLDVKITAYIVPVAEQPQASLTPVISVANIADEGAVITGLIRIYRESTGLMIYSSELAVTQLEHHSTTNIAALTPFDPPSPADDDYFIKADITATSYLPGPPTHDSLGAWYFDIKTPPMGEAPAGHGTTHELGGSDEVSHGALEGLADDDHPQYQEEDEEGVAGGYCGLPDPLDSTLPLRADGTPARPKGAFYENDFLDYTTGEIITPWELDAVSSGTGTVIPGLPTHPGILGLNSSTSANSGMRILTRNNSFSLAGGEDCIISLRPGALAGTLIRFGYHDASSTPNVVDGCYIEMFQVGGIDGVIDGKTSSNSVRSTTGTNYTLITNTWYTLRVKLNSDATRVDFYLYDATGSQLWTDFLTTNIPTGIGRETGQGMLIYNTGTTALLLSDVDYMYLWVKRTLFRQDS